MDDMKSELFHIGSFTVYGYGLMIGLGVIAAYLMGEHRAKKKEMRVDLIFNLVIWCLVGGILGAKLLYYITILPDIMADPSLLWKSLTNGFVVYGGIIFGILAGYLYTRKHKLNFLEYFDLAMPSIALAQGFGRLGCLLAGCCYGAETDSAFHMVFPETGLAPAGVPLVPTQLLSSVLNFLHCFFLLWYSGRKKASGEVAALYLICYSIGRFILEFFRGDLERGSVGALSTSQFISLFLVVAGLLLFFVSRKRQEKQEWDAVMAESEETEETND